MKLCFATNVFVCAMPVLFVVAGSLVRLSAQVATPPEPPTNLTDLLKRPLDVDGFQDQGSEDGNRPFFDDYSWRAFVALNWPAKQSVRGEPDEAKEFGDLSSPKTVWETWKSGSEILPSTGKPDPWDKVESIGILTNLFKEKANRTRFLADFVRYEDINQAGFGKFEAPLIDQGGNYVRFELRVNKIEYEHIRNEKLYTKDGLQKAFMMSGKPIEFPQGSIQIKAAWRELPEAKEILNHFYWRDAVVLNWDKDGKEIPIRTKVGLVGLHIVTRTKERPNWIWSTFEHEDNISTSPGGINPPSFNKEAQGTPWPGKEIEKPSGWEKIRKGKPLPTLPNVEVSRKHRTQDFPATERINRGYREHKAVKNTVWSHYKLIRTQWPILDSGKPSPKQDVANVTMETYRQKVTCMACHGQAKKCSFVYFLEARLFPDETRRNLDRFLHSLD